MALKFVKTPVKRQAPRRKLIVAPKRKILVQEYAIDQFGELGARKKSAAARARSLGHDMLPWHRRPNDPAGRWNAFCASCNKPMVVCTEAPEGMPDAYGPALTTECGVTVATEGDTAK